MQDLIQQLHNFNQNRDWEQFHSPKNLSMALSVEAAELMEHFQWLTQDESRTLPDDKKEKVEEEIGDVLLYLLNLSDKLDIDPTEAARAKLRKNADKYPAHKAKGSATKYTEL